MRAQPPAPTARQYRSTGAGGPSVLLGNGPGRVPRPPALVRRGACAPAPRAHPPPPPPAQVMGKVSIGISRGEVFCGDVGLRTLRKAYDVTGTPLRRPPPPRGSARGTGTCQVPSARPDDTCFGFAPPIGPDSVREAADEVGELGGRGQNCNAAGGVERRSGRVWGAGFEAGVVAFFLSKVLRRKSGLHLRPGPSEKASVT